MRFLSPEWVAALDDAARARPTDPDDPLSSVTLSIDQVVTDGPHYRLRIDAGSLHVESEPTGTADVRLISDRATAAAIASGARAALDAFIAGDLQIGGNTTALLEHRVALEAIGDLFAAVRAATRFD